MSDSTMCGIRWDDPDHCDNDYVIWSLSPFPDGPDLALAIERSNAGIFAFVTRADLPGEIAICHLPDLVWEDSSLVSDVNISRIDDYLRDNVDEIYPRLRSLTCLYPSTSLSALSNQVTASGDSANDAEGWPELSLDEPARESGGAMRHGR